MKFSKIFWALICVLIPLRLVIATDYAEPVRTIEDITSNAKKQTVYRLQHASVLIADYDLIRADFPATIGLSNPEIDQWLLNHVGFISDTQANQTIVNTPIEVTDEVKEVFRPPRYGRALVYPMTDPKDASKAIGLVDAKGVGSVSPSQASHGNGLATLGESIREYLYEKMVNEVMEKEDIGTKTIGSYAVIDPGFDVVHADGSQSPAGFYLRQAHHRNDSEYIRGAQETKIKAALAKYGIDANGNHQGSSSNHLMDFGHYVVSDEVPGIEKAKGLPTSVWGYDKTMDGGSGRWKYSKWDRPWMWSHDLADGWRKGHANRHHVWLHFQNFMRPLNEILGKGNSGCFSKLTQIRY